MTDSVAGITSHRVHIVGASGSGTSTLGRALAAELQWPFFDTDSFYWMPSTPPFQHKRDIPERIALLDAAVSRDASWVLSGSLSGWGDVFIPCFTDVVFLTLDPGVRLGRLKEREVARYGEGRISPGGDLHNAHEAFMAWAARYDVRGHAERSLERHETWLAQLPRRINVHRLDSAQSSASLVKSIRGAIGQPGT